MPTEMMKCPKCGEDNSPERQDCFWCGALFQEESAKHDIPGSGPAIRAPKIVPFIIIGFVSLYVVGMLFYWFATRQPKSPAAIPASQPVPSQTPNPTQDARAGAERPAPVSAFPPPNPQQVAAPVRPVPVAQPAGDAAGTGGASLQSEARATLDAFAALSSRLDVEMNYRDYVDAVATAKAALDHLAQQPGANNLPAMEYLGRAYAEYAFAKSVWEVKINALARSGSSPKTDMERNGFFDKKSPYGKILVSEYGVPISHVPQYESETVWLNHALPAIWDRGQQYIKAAEGY